MDEKYKGCNIVESVVTTPTIKQKAPSKPRDVKEKSHLFVRLVISALIIGAILVIHYFPTLAFSGAVTEGLRKVFCYDVFGRTTFGTTIFG